MKRARALLPILCLIAAAASAVSCGVSPTSVASKSSTSEPVVSAATPSGADDSAEPTDAEVQAILSKLPDEAIVGSNMMGSSIEELVKGAWYVAVVKVIESGPYFNSRRLGERGELGPDPEVYSICQLYRAQVERWLKGSGPDTIWFDQGMGYLPGRIAPTKAAIKAAKLRSGVAPHKAGDRFLLFLGPPQQVPELKALSWYPRATRLPRTFELRPDGTAVASAHDRSSREAVERIFPKGSERVLIQEIEQAVVDTRK